MNRHKVRNPWGLTHAEVDTMDVLIVNARHKHIAAKLGVGASTVEWHISRALKKMGESHSVQAAIKWAEWRKGDGLGIPA